jgi:hypothetical protein
MGLEVSLASDQKTEGLLLNLCSPDSLGMLGSPSTEPCAGDKGKDDDDYDSSMVR